MRGREGAVNMTEYIVAIDVRQNNTFPGKVIILGKLYLNLIGRGEFGVSAERWGCWIQRWLWTRSLTLLLTSLIP